MVQIVNYEPKYARAFGDLNKEWIETFFEMEASDYKSLDNPKEYILDRGGSIFIALLNDIPVGACALVRHNDGLFELSKMAVTPTAQGNKIGLRLAEQIILKAKELQVENLFLITNSMLKPAISLYEKLGFVFVENFKSEYKRGDVKMELVLTTSSFAE